jgi:hypothetical protein
MAKRPLVNPKIGFLNSTDNKGVQPGSANKLIVAFRVGLNDSGGTKFDLSEESAGAEYGHSRNKRKKLNNGAKKLITGGVDLIVASGGIVSARAAVKAAAKKDKKVLVCIGRDDPELGDDLDVDVGGINLNTPDANNHRLALLLQANAGLEEEDVWLVVNSNSAMGRQERDEWEAHGRQCLETGKDRENKEGKLKSAFDYALDNGAAAFIISSDPFFTSKADKIRALTGGKPACFAFKQCLDTTAGANIAWGYDLEKVYQNLGTQAKNILTSVTAELNVVSMLPEMFDKS